MEATPAFSTDSRIAPEKRPKKWRFTLPARPPRPSSSVPGEPIWIETPSGRISAVQITKARDLAQRHGALVLADQPAAARDEHLAAVEAAHVAADDGAGEAGQVGIDRRLQHAGDDGALGHDGAQIGHGDGRGRCRRSSPTRLANCSLSFDLRTLTVRGAALAASPAAPGAAAATARSAARAGRRDRPPGTAP